MKIKWESVAWDEYVNWQTNKAMIKRINLLVKDIQRTPFEGLGKPEPLKHKLSGYWSRRIDDVNLSNNLITSEPIRRGIGHAVLMT